MISIRSIFSYICWYLRPLLKWFLRKTTNLCELERICYGEKPNAPRTLAVENCLRKSRDPILRGLPYLRDNKPRMTYYAACLYATTYVTTTKKVKPKTYVPFMKSFRNCMSQIWGYRVLMSEIEELRQKQYDTHNPRHEEKLLKLWELLVPDTKLESRVTKMWQYIGFQGDDPKTDFRGMGILGLENLLYLATTHTSVARRMVVRSHHPTQGYAFAIVGINMTHLAYCLVKDGAAKTHVYNKTRVPHLISTFHSFYCYLFIEFHRFWTLSKPKNIMDFSFIRDKFEKNIRKSLEDPKTKFNISVMDDI